MGKISGVEIFSGAGGLATGLGLSGVAHNALVEWDSDACSTLRRNYGSQIVHESDIRTFDFTPYSGIDIIAGGPPCQPFSLGGKAKGKDDNRDMFPSAVRAIREMMPKVFFFENVKGILRPSFREYFHYIVQQLSYPQLVDDSGDWRRHSDKIIRLSKSEPSNRTYRVTVNLVNAADYGVPQKRERVVIIGIRNDIGRIWTLPAATHSCASLQWAKYATGEYWEQHSISPSNEEYRSFSQRKAALQAQYGFFPPEQKPWVTIRDALTDIPKEGDKAYFPDEHKVRKGAREYPGHTGSPIDEPAKTIKAGGHGVPGGENMIKFSDGSVRYFTVFEAKRLQTFPDGYQILGPWSEAMRQLGNAVPVALAKAICDSIVQSVLLL